MLTLENNMMFHQLKELGLPLRAISCHTSHHRQMTTKYLRHC